MIEITSSDRYGISWITPVAVDGSIRLPRRAPLGVPVVPDVSRTGSERQRCDEGSPPSRSPQFADVDRRRPGISVTIGGCLVGPDDDDRPVEAGSIHQVPQIGIDDDGLDGFTFEHIEHLRRSRTGVECRRPRRMPWRRRSSSRRTRDGCGTARPTGCRARVRAPADPWPTRSIAGSSSAYDILPRWSMTAEACGVASATLQREPPGSGPSVSWRRRAPGRDVDRGAPIVTPRRARSTRTPPRSDGRTRRPSCTVPSQHVGVVVTRSNVRAGRR